MLYLQHEGQLFGKDWIDERALIGHLSALGAFAGGGDELDGDSGAEQFAKEFGKRGGYWYDNFRWERQDKHHKGTQFFFWRIRDVGVINTPRAATFRLLDFLTETKQRLRRASLSIQYCSTDNPTSAQCTGYGDFVRIDADNMVEKVPEYFESGLGKQPTLKKRRLRSDDNASPVVILMALLQRGVIYHPRLSVESVYVPVRFETAGYVVKPRASIKRAIIKRPSAEKRHAMWRAAEARADATEAAAEGLGRVAARTVSTTAAAAAAVTADVTEMAEMSAHELIEMFVPDEVRKRMRACARPTTTIGPRAADFGSLTQATQSRAGEIYTHIATEIARRLFPQEPEALVQYMLEKNSTFANFLLPTIGLGVAEEDDPAGLHGAG